MTQSSQMLSISQAVERVTANIIPMEVETVPLVEGLNRILAEDIVAPLNVPDFDNSAMDGYAVHDVKGLDLGSRLKVIGCSYAGHPFSGALKKGEAVRVTTGAPIPVGTDAVVMQEEVEAFYSEACSSENSSVASEIILAHLPKSSEYIRLQGHDIKKGSSVFNAGLKLTPKELPVIASLGIAQCRVFKRPRVAFFSTGDELCEPGSVLKSGQIYESNRYCISAMLERMNCESIYLGCLPDNKAVIRDAFQRASQQADLVITSGGVSVGDADYVKLILQELGLVDFWKIAVKPGKPFAYGSIGAAKFCGLPGNPVSAMVTFYLFVQPLLAKMSGHSQWKPAIQIQARATSRFKKLVSRTEYQRGVYSVNGQGELEVRSVSNQSSDAFHAASGANCFIVLPPSNHDYEIGDFVKIELFSDLLS